MHAATITFLVLLVYAHFAFGATIGLPASAREVIGRPLSMFRDTTVPELGYLLFALIGIIGVCMIRTMDRIQRYGEACLFGLGLAGLAYVATTSSYDWMHGLCAVGLFGLTFTYYAVVFAQARSFLLLVHVLAPIAIAFLTRDYEYGLGQKSLIVYFVLLMNLHQLLLRLELPRWQRDPRRSFVPPLRKRIIYVLNGDDG